MQIITDSVNEAYKRLSIELLTNGIRISPRHAPTLELTNVQLQILYPAARFITFRSRAMDMRYCVGELCFFLSGSTSLNFINRYSKFWNKVSDDGQTINSAYGNRLFYQRPNSLDYAVNTLKTDINSRKAVMPIYQLSDSKPSLDNPCTMFLQFLIRDDLLDCYTFMRSNDAWLGVPYDIAFFTTVQEIALVKLKAFYPSLRLGTYYHTVTSMHAYERDLDGLENVAAEDIPPSLYAPPITLLDLDPWFKHLLDVETGVQSRALPTDFQLWCENFL